MVQDKTEPEGIRWNEYVYTLDSPLRSQQLCGRSDFLAPARARGRFLSLTGSFLNLKTVQYMACTHNLLPFVRKKSLSETVERQIKDCHAAPRSRTLPWRRARRHAGQGGAHQACPRPACRPSARGCSRSSARLHCTLRLGPRVPGVGSFLSSWRGSRRSRFLNA